MRCGRFAVPAFWCLLAGLVAVSLAPASTPVAVVTCSELADPCLVESRDPSPPIDIDALLDANTPTNAVSKPLARGTSRFVATAGLPRAQCPTLSARSNRAPPIA
jgi:hypothetical protein